MASGAPYFAGYPADYTFAQPQEPPKPESPKPPKRPLTPYMRFSKSVWQSVKAANPGFSICEIGATIGRMWRELGEEEKQRHMEDFTKDKVRYDDELQSYLKSQGLRSLKQKAKKKPEPKQTASAPAASVPAVRRDAGSAAISAQPPPAHSTPAATQQQQLAQAFMGLPIAGMGGGLPMAVGMPPGMMGMLPHFSQYVGGQPVMQLQLSAQQQAGAQELYANGYADASAAATGSAGQKQMAPPARQSSADYRYPQSYN